MPLVLLHPIGLDASCWRFMELPDAIALDFPGHGEAAAWQVPPTMESLADDVAARTTGPLDLVGLSLGGAVAQHVALRHPDRVRSLVVACTSPKTNTEALEDRARAVEADGMEGVLDLTLQRWFTPGALAEDGHPGVAYARERLRTDDPAVFAAFWRALAHHDAVERLPQLRVPVTVVMGARDEASSPAGLRLMADRLPQARLVTVDGPHMLQLESPDELRAVLSDHLAWAASA